MFVFFTLLYILVIILTSSVIREGESEKKMVSWTLYAFGIIFGIVVISILWFVKSDDPVKKKMLMYTIPILTSFLTVSNIVGMILSKPKLHLSQLFVPYLTNIIFMICSIFLSLSISQK